MTDLTRDALIGEASDALVGFTPVGVLRNGRVVIPVEQSASIAVDAVLRLLVDDLERVYRERWADFEQYGIRDVRSRATARAFGAADALASAISRLRFLLPEGDDQ